MINRELIRLKVVQLVYAYSKNGENSLEAAEKEFLFSLDKGYELYHALLYLLVSLGHMATRMVEMQQSRAKRLNEKDVPVKFINNRFLAQLRSNKLLREYQEHSSIQWTEEEEAFLRKTYNLILEQDFYREYMSSRESSYEEDRELWRRIYRNLLCNNDELDDILEEHSLYWNDDKVIIDTFVLKTIRRFEEANGSLQPLLPEFKDEEDRRFATQLFHTALANGEYFHTLIEEQTQNWEIDRIAAMDLVIMQIALAEITTFPQIPISVSINEYVELAKLYSTPRSGGYINGMLDTIAKRLIEEGKIEKA